MSTMNCSASGQKTMIDLGGTTTLTRQLYDEITRCKDRIMGCSSHKEATPYLNRLQFLSNCLTRPARNVASSLYSMLNEYCKQVEGNTTKTVGLLDVSRAFPVRGITVQDQAYAVPNDSLPAGYYPALSPDVDAINVECYIHTRDDLPEPEAPEEDEEETSGSRISSAVRDILSGGNQND